MKRIGLRRVAPALAMLIAMGAMNAAVNAQVMISQIYGGGNNQGSLFTADYIELYNAGASAVNFATTPHSIHYRAAAGTSWTKVTINAGTIPASGYYLIRTINAGTAYLVVNLPTPDLTATTPDMSATAGVVALYDAGTTVLTASSACPPAITSGGGNLLDLVGWGSTATCSEPTASNSTANNAPGGSNQNSMFRRLCGSGDGNNNGSDFFVGLPNPRNSQTAPNNGIGVYATGSPAVVRAGDSGLLIAIPRNCSGGNVLGATVTVNLTAVGGSPTQTMFDDGTNGDELAGDGIYSYSATVPSGTAAGTVALPVTASSGGNSGGSYLSLAISANSPGQPNDSCRTAVAIAPTGTPGTPNSYGATGVSMTGNLSGCREESNPVNNGFNTNVSMNATTAARKGVWFKCIGTGTTMTADQCTTTPTFDSNISVMCGTCDGLSVVAFGDDECGSSLPRASWCSQAGMTYYLWCATFSTSAFTNSFTLRITDDGVSCATARPCTQCTITPPGGAVIEAETNAGPSTNDGCDASSISGSTAQAFRDVTVGASPISIFGTSRAYGAGSSTAGQVDNDWYRFQAGATDVLGVSCTAQFPVSIQLRQLSASGTCATNTLVNSATAERCATATLSGSLTAGNWYAIKVAPNLPSGNNNNSGFAVGATSNAYLLSVQLGVPPANDACANAIALTLGAAAISGSTQNATNDGSASCDTGGAASRDVWYRVTVSTAPAPNAGLRIDTCGSAIDTVLSVYTGTCGSLTEIACNDDCASGLCGGPSSCLTIPAPVATGTYMIRVSDKGLTAGAISIRAGLVPANDLCANAIAVSVGAFPFDTTGATTDGAVFSPNCEPSDTGTNAQQDIWYLYSPPCTGMTTLSTCSAGTLTDTLVAVYPAGVCPPTDASRIACDDDIDSPFTCAISSLRSALSFNAVFGQQYLIRVGGFGAAVGTGTLTITSGPANDSCSTAATITVTSGTATVMGDNSCATDDGLTPSCGATSKDLWWTFTTGAAQGGNWRINTCGSAVDTVLSVYSGACPGTEIACNDDATTGVCSATLQSEVVVALAASTQYRVRVASKGAGAAGGSLTLNLAAEITPANDNCASPAALTVGALASTGNTTFATNDGSASCDPGAAASHDLWYAITLTSPPQNVNLVVDTCGSAIDTALSVYTGTCGSLTEVACNDDCTGGGCGGPASCLTLPAPLASGTYLVRVSDKGLTPGNFSVKAAFSAPVNDLCSNAAAISEGTTPWSNVGAATDGLVYGSLCDAQVGGSDTGTNSNSDIWYLYSPTCSAVTTVTTCGTPGMGTALGDTVIAVYTVGTCPPADANRIACDDDIDAPFSCATGGTLRSALTFNAVRGTQYLIRVGSFSTTTTGTGLLNISQPADTTPPSLTCGSDQTASADAVCMAAVTDFTATASALDNCPGSVTLTQSPTAGTLVGLGATLVTVTATDAAGNMSMCTANFIVNDTTAPSITTCAGAQSVAGDANCQATVPDFTTGVVATDNCTPSGSLVITQSPTAGSTVTGAGPHTVVLTVTDGASNAATCNAVLTVTDGIAPIFSGCPADITVKVTGANCTATATWTPPTANDNCDGAITPVGSHTPGSTFSAANNPTTVTYTATDAAGNMSTCSFNVTVQITSDLNDDGVVDQADVDIMVAVLLEIDTTPLHIYRADQNCDGTVDGDDIQGFENGLP